MNPVCQCTRWLFHLRELSNGSKNLQTTFLCHLKTRECAPNNIWTKIEIWKKWFFMFFSWFSGISPTPFPGFAPRLIKICPKCPVPGTVSPSSERVRQRSYTLGLSTEYVHKEKHNETFEFGNTKKADRGYRRIATYRWPPASKS